ncbi:MAG TPA: excinuclease ABC subunit UvrC [Candidatus Paceibacterota bacterium]|nr:excinuclease ABC subunit UvrC [Verrucomicrobiota bacterium]HRZ45123.1 excinuclease ABC subunit UvrC [Candidatus Paceibacterota bacterium]HRZ93237.1 excinuclease ABC subunit UvrC [Candidatus Paceibacterota bacterium]
MNSKGGAVIERLRAKLTELPHRPGVYLMKDRLGRVIYVGKARDLRRRVSQYFHPGRRHGWDLKLRALVDAICDFEAHPVRSEPEALLLEGRLIKEWHPRYNVSFRDDKRFLSIKINCQDPIPGFALTRLRTEDGAQYFGPFAHSAAARRTLALVRRQFRLRGCRVLTPGEADYRHCIYANLRYCTAPCIGNVTRSEYMEQVRAACDFLAGQCAEMEHQLESEMRRAAAAQEFEQAAQWRDLLDDLRSTTRKMHRFARLPPNLPHALDPEHDLAELARALDLPGPPRRIEGFDISNISDTFLVASMVSFLDGRADRQNYRRYRIRSVSAQDDVACMAETIRRRYSRQVREGAPAPDLILIDGGPNQLGAAMTELRRLGLERTPVIGLAKEHEEIHRPGAAAPLRLEPDSPALKLLQRVRDESHRFANTYNAQLRLRRISESVLDEFPGIGGQRKRALLKRFGSVRRLRLATADEIAQVPGCGGKVAAELKAFLEARQGSPGRR